TAFAAEATAAEMAIENAQATALAETQAGIPTPELPPAELPGFESPLATPGSADASGIPGFETPTEPPSPLPTDILPPGDGAEAGDAAALVEPGAGLTVVPGPVPVEVATETPVILVLIVTNTPEPGAPTSEVQRPIVYPT